MEIWKDVIGYEGYYQVSSVGNVKRIKSPNRPVEKLRKIQYKKNGYAVVMLSVKQKYKLAHVHRLVAMSFIENTENKPQINHKDLNKKNNNVENLEWVTLRENVNHVNALKKWKNNAKKGIDNKRSISVWQFRLDGTKLKEWVNISDAAKHLNISSGEITIVCQKKRKSAGGFQWKYAKDDTCISVLDYGRRKVLQFNMDGSFVKEHESGFVASKENNLSSAGIWNCCNGKSKYCGKYIWEYKELHTSHNLISTIKSPLNAINL